MMEMAGKGLLQGEREWLDVGVRSRGQVEKSEGIWWTGREMAMNRHRGRMNKYTYNRGRHCVTVPVFPL